MEAIDEAGEISLVSSLIQKKGDGRLRAMFTNPTSFAQKLKVGTSVGEVAEVGVVELSDESQSEGALQQATDPQPEDELQWLV